MKRSLSIVLVLALVLGMFSAFALSAGAADETTTANEPTATEPEPTPSDTEPGTPTEPDAPVDPDAPLPVATAEDFAAMEAGKNYYLTADITVTATYTTTFTGTFDGKGFTVTTSVPLFKMIAGATVKNLILAGEVTSTGDRVAVLAEEGKNFTLENVVNNANVNASAKTAFVGALVGEAVTGGGTAGAHERCYFNNCVNKRQTLFNKPPCFCHVPRKPLN